VFSEGWKLEVTFKITKVPETLRRLYDVRGWMVTGCKFKDLRAEARPLFRAFFAGLKASATKIHPSFFHGQSRCQGFAVGPEQAYVCSLLLSEYKLIVFRSENGCAGITYQTLFPNITTEIVLLISRQFLHGPIKIGDLRQDGVFQQRLVGDEGVGGGHTADGGIEMLEKSVGDAGGDFGAVSPA